MDQLVNYGKAIVSDLIQQRQTARKQRDFAAAGIAVVDQPDGEVRWHRQ